MIGGKKNKKKNVLHWNFPNDEPSSNKWEIVEQNNSKKLIFSKNSKGTRDIYGSIRSILSLLIPVTCAIVVGVAFGFFSLALANQQSPSDISSDSSSVETASAQAEDSENSNGYQIDLTAPVIQAGVYSSLDSAKEQIALLPNDLPSEIIQHEDKYYLLEGVESTLEDAKATAKKLDSSDITAYAKEFIISKKTSTELSEDQENNLAIAIENFNKILEVISSDDPEAIKNAELTSISVSGDETKFDQLMQTHEKLVKSFEKYQKKQTSKQTKSLTQQMLSFLGDLENL